MPLQIVQNDIANMCADAIVNTANPLPQVGQGVDTALHAKAGPMLLEARRRIGAIPPGQAAVTPAYGLDARYVIHAVAPPWQDGTHRETELLRRCYDNALDLARQRQCRSVAFPLMGAGSYGFPPQLAMQIALEAFNAFLLHHEMQIWLVVFSREAVTLSEQLFVDVQRYIDDHYVQEKKREEYGFLPDDAEAKHQLLRRRRMAAEAAAQEIFLEDRAADFDAAFSAPPKACASAAPKAAPVPDLDAQLARLDAGFSETLLRMIDLTGKKDSDIYKKANVDRKLFSKIRSNPGYQPKKPTALAFAVALELDLEQTRDLLARAGYALNRSSKLDVIVEYFIRKKSYNIHQINLVLFQYDLPALGGKA